MPQDSGIGLYVIAVLAALAVGFALGRRTGRAHARIRQLESQLEIAAKERELAQASVEAAKAEIARGRAELEKYRGDVVDHFTGTSELLRELTVQYRAVYDHLTNGATTLCPEGSVGLPEGLQPERLPEGAGVADSEPAAEEPRDDSVAETPRDEVVAETPRDEAAAKAIPPRA